MTMNKYLTYCGYAGSLLILTSAFLYVVIIRHPMWIAVMFTIGVLLLTLHRFVGPDSDLSRSNDKSKSLTLRRLYRQRVFGVCILYLCVLLLFIHPGFYFGYYIVNSMWFLPFIIFTVVELYTAFRIPSAEKKEGNLK